MNYFSTNYNNGRELKSKEKTEIKKLVKTMCANYFAEYDICLPYDKPCVILQKRFTGGINCSYFNNAVLLLNSELEKSLNNMEMDMKSCAICNTSFVKNGKQKYCSDKCRYEAHKKQSKNGMDKMRKK